MFINAKEKPILSLIILFNKTPIFLKFNNYSSYFFLTNNFMLISNYYYFFYFSDNLIKLKKLTYNQLIKRNGYFFFTNILKFRKYTRLCLILNKFKFKFNTLFKFIFLNKFKKINKNFKFFQKFIYYNNININRYYTKRFYKNWENLIGNSISPHSLLLFSKKKWIRKNKNFNFFLNRFFTKNKIKRSFSMINKKHIINSLFYLNKSTNFQNYPLLRFLIKNNINYSIMRKNNYDFFLSRPYMFLNNPRGFKNFRKHPNFLSFNLYKKYSKFFSSLRRINISNRIRVNNSFVFKNFLSYTKTLFKTPRSRNFLNLKPIFNWFSFFNIKNKLPFSLSKKIQKKRFFYLWHLSFVFKTKTFKKNKFFAISKFFLNKNLEIIKFSRKIKKGNLFLKNTKLIKKFFLLVFSKVNWSIEFFFLFFKYFFFFTPSIVFLKTKNFFFIWKNLFYNFFKIKNLFNIFKNFVKKIPLIRSKLKKPFFLSKTKTNFILNKYGFIFVNNFYMTCNTKTTLFYNFKKLMFSFSYKNEIQKYVLRKYSKINFSTNFNNLQSNKFFFNRSVFFFSKNSSFNFSYFDSFLIKKNELYPLLLQNTANKTNWTYFNNQIRFAFNSENEQINFNIKRIKFKPGYMTIWRDARLVLKTSLMLKIKYQYKLTNYLSKYKKFINFKTFLFMEMRLFNILIKSRLFNDSSLLTLFLKNNLIFLNGSSCSNPNLQLFYGDFVQLVINLKYYILYRWFSNLSLKKKNKLRNVLRKKNNNFNQSDEKKKSYSFPKWILYSKNAIDDVSNFLEIDYLTLSIFILYEPFNWNDINAYNLIDQRFTIINLYNWKYIT